MVETMSASDFTTVRASSPMQEEFEKVSTSLGALEIAVSALENKLQPVLTPGNSVPMAEKDSVPVESSEYVGMLREMDRVAYLLRVRLEGLASRVEV